MTPNNDHHHDHEDNGVAAAVAAVAIIAAELDVVTKALGKYNTLICISINLKLSLMFCDYSAKTIRLKISLFALSCTMSRINEFLNLFLRSN